MARMYSRKRGKAGSRKPAKAVAPWVAYKPEEIAEIVVKLSHQGLQVAQVGQALRDQYGIPTTRINKTKLLAILRKHKLEPEIPDDLFNLLKKAVYLHMHMTKNKRDYTSYRGLELTESKIRRLSQYYVRNKKLPQDWKYSIDRARLLVK